MTGSQLRRIRERFHLSRAQLAGQVRVAPKTLYSYETGERSIPYHRQLAFAHIFHKLGQAGEPAMPCPTCGGVGLLPERRT